MRKRASGSVSRAGHGASIGGDGMVCNLLLHMQQKFVSSPLRNYLQRLSLTALRPALALKLAKSAKLCVFSPRGNPVAVPVRLSRWSGGLGGRRRRTDSTAGAVPLSASIPVGFDPRRIRHQQALVHLRNRHGSRAIFTARSNQLAFDSPRRTGGVCIFISRRAHGLAA